MVTELDLQFENGNPVAGICRNYELKIESINGRYYAKGFRKNNAVSCEGYLDTLEQGLWKYYYPDGKLESTLNFKSSVRHGWQVIYDTTGRWTDSIIYVNGKRHGKVTSIDYKRHTTEIRNFRDGLLHGIYSKISNSADTISFGNYMNDKKAGIWTNKVYGDDVFSGCTHYAWYKNDMVIKEIYKYNNMIIAERNYSPYYRHGIHYQYDFIKTRLLDSTEYSFDKICFQPKRFIEEIDIVRYLKPGEVNGYNVTIEKNEFGIERTDKKFGTTLEILEVWKVDTANQKNILRLTVTKDWKGMKGWSAHDGSPSYFYYPDGSLKSKVTGDTTREYFHNGRINKILYPGFEQTYYPNGQLKCSRYQTSKYVFGAKYFDSNGKLLFSEIYNNYERKNQTVNELKEGKWEDGNSVVSYLNGKPNGVYYEFHNSNDNDERWIKEKGAFLNGKLNGNILKYDEFGDPISERIFKNGILTGVNFFPQPQPLFKDSLSVNTVMVNNGNYVLLKSDNEQIIVDLNGYERVSKSLMDDQQFSKYFLSNNGHYLLTFNYFYGDLRPSIYPDFESTITHDKLPLGFSEDYRDFQTATFSADDKYLYVLSTYNKRQATESMKRDFGYVYQVKDIFGFDSTKNKILDFKGKHAPFHIVEIQPGVLAEIYYDQINYRGTANFTLLDSFLLHKDDSIQYFNSVQYHNGFLVYQSDQKSLHITDVKNKKNYVLTDNNLLNYRFFKLYNNDSLCFVSPNHFYFYDVGSGKISKVKNKLKTNHLTLTQKNEWFYIASEHAEPFPTRGTNYHDYFADPQIVINDKLRAGWYNMVSQEIIGPLMMFKQFNNFSLNFDTTTNKILLMDIEEQKYLSMDLKTANVAPVKNIDSRSVIDTFYFKAHSNGDKMYIGDYSGGYFKNLTMKDEKTITNSSLFYNPLYPDKYGQYVQWYGFANGASIFICADRYYKGDKSAAETMGFGLKLHHYPLQQFDLKYNRPDIILQRLGYSDSATIAAYHYAYLKRLKRMGFTEDMLQEDLHLPEIRIINDKYIPLTTDSSGLNLDIEMKDSKYKLDRLNIYINDVPVFGSAGIDLRKENVRDIKKRFSLSLVPGQNIIQVSVLNQAGAESYKQTLNVLYKPEKVSKPDLYLITIGDSRYKDARYDLTYASKDAEDISAGFKKNNAYKNIFTYIYTNEKVTKENILKLKEELKKAKRDDVVIITIAGHGVLDKDLNYYLATYDMDFNNPSKRGLPYEEIEALVDGIAPLKKVIFLDACHSGEVDKEEVEQLAINTSSANGVKFRSAGAGIQKKNLGLKTTSELMGELFSDLRKGTGATVISSAGGKEYAMESDQWQNGLFTYCMLHGLKDKAADANADGQIMLSELQQFLRTEVTRLSNGAQQPTSRIENLNLDFRIW